MRSLVLAGLVATMLVGGVARAADSKAPDVRHGERYDGRDARPSVRPYLLAVPRLLLVVPRLAVRGIDAAARPLMQWNEREHIAERVVGALTSDDGLIGVRPAVNFESGYRPSFGVLYFTERLPRGTRVTVSSAIGGPETLLQDAHATVPLWHRRAALDVDARYRRRDDELYTGIGMHSPLPFARYAVDQVDAGALFSLRPLDKIRLELGVAYGLSRFADGAAYSGDRPI